MNILAQIQSAQLLMFAGFVLLGWVVARRTIAARKRVNRDTRSAKKALDAMRNHKEPSVPLSDAPPEIQRWQVAMFDTQRVLTAELDTRIAIIQSLITQVDQRIDELAVCETAAEQTRENGAAILAIRGLAQSGLTAKEISEQLSVSIGDVELTLASTTPETEQP